MRPHRLRVTAFGAFGGTVEVCFDDLASAGLFLLHGETGAGKTTLLDAIGFALYGQVPGERGKTKRLRSDHAAASTRTEVQLEATIGGRRMRITRKPEQERPKLRGQGTTTEQMKVLLEESDRASWRAVSTRAGEADDEISQLMGMPASQFFQVVLLPQGEFAKFLHANAGDRAKLLQKLFGTDRFRDVEDWLAERRRTTAREVEEAERGITELTARVAQVADVPVPGDEPASAALPDDQAALPDDQAALPDDQAALPHEQAGLPDDQAGLPHEQAGLPHEQAAPRDGRAVPSAEWAGRLAVAAAAGAAASKAQVSGYRHDLDQALDLQRGAERLADRQRRRLDALRTRDELAVSEASVAQLRGELSAAARAAEIAPALTEAERTGDALDQARAEEEQARLAAVHAGAPQTATAGELRQAGQERLAQAGRLEALRSLARQAADENESAAAARAAAAALTAEIDAAGQDVRAGQQQRPELSRQRDQAQQAGQKLPAVQAEADRCRRAADDASALVQARADVGRQSDAYANARVEMANLLVAASRLREARIDGMRAELAASLVDGTPCPVCGSLDHPELCELPGERVTREQEEAAYSEAEIASESAEMIAAKLAAADILVANLTVRLEAAGFTAAADLVALSEQAARLAAGADELAGEAAQLAATAAPLSDLVAALDTLEADQAGAEKRLVELTEQREFELRQAIGADQRAARLRESLLAQLDGAPDLDTAVRTVRAAASALTAAADAADATARASEAAQRAAHWAARAAADAGFEGLDVVRHAQRDADWRAAADQAIREHEAAATAVKELLADPDLDVPLDPPADVAGAAVAVDAAREACDGALAAHDRARHKAEQLADLAPQLTARLDGLRPVVARAAEVRRLADLAAGQGANTLKMTLSSFVLAARLEEVAAAASERLLKMTSGRYSLVHTDERRGGSGKSGLGLLACDSWTGMDRDTSTLSGGETFLASLALALGLADTVTAEAGGTRIEALFVDEGFGSLDEDTLEEVMTVLDGLREGGRMVGIVSHVAELRQRIPAQVRVHKGQAGSHLDVRVLGG